MVALTAKRFGWFSYSTWPDGAFSLHLARPAWYKRACSPKVLRLPKMMLCYCPEAVSLFCNVPEV
jgi:hypothetical protein